MDQLTLTEDELEALGPFISRLGPIADQVQQRPFVGKAPASRTKTMINTYYSKIEQRCAKDGRYEYFIPNVSNHAITDAHNVDFSLGILSDYALLTFDDRLPPVDCLARILSFLASLNQSPEQIELLHQIGNVFKTAAARKDSLVSTCRSIVGLFKWVGPGTDPLLLTLMKRGMKEDGRVFNGFILSLVKILLSECKEKKQKLSMNLESCNNIKSNFIPQGYHLFHLVNEGRSGHSNMEAWAELFGEILRENPNAELMAALIALYVETKDASELLSLKLNTEQDSIPVLYFADLLKIEHGKLRSLMRMLSLNSRLAAAVFATKLLSQLIVTMDRKFQPLGFSSLYSEFMFRTPSDDQDVYYSSDSGSQPLPKRSKKTSGNVFHGLAHTGKVKELRRRLYKREHITADEDGSLLNEVDVDGNSPLYLAVKANHIEVVKLLLAHGAAVEPQVALDAATQNQTGFESRLIFLGTENFSRVEFSSLTLIVISHCCQPNCRY